MERNPTSRGENAERAIARRNSTPTTSPSETMGTTATAEMPCLSTASRTGSSSGWRRASSITSGLRVWSTSRISGYADRSMRSSRTIASSLAATTQPVPRCASTSTREQRSTVSRPASFSTTSKSNRSVSPLAAKVRVTSSSAARSCVCRSISSRSRRARASARSNGGRSAAAYGARTKPSRPSAICALAPAGRIPTSGP